MSLFSIDQVKLVTPLDEVYGGTGTNTYTPGDILYASNSTTLTKLNIGATGEYIGSNGSVPSWQTPTGKGSIIATSAFSGNQSTTGIYMGFYQTHYLPSATFTDH